MIDDILELNGLSVEYLTELSYMTKLGKSLKNSLRHFNKEDILAEVFDYADWLDTQDLYSVISIDFRIKAYESMENKYNRYYPNRSVAKVFNDVLGFRAFCDRYSDLQTDDTSKFRFVDMSKGKANDDGYRGVHLYFQVDNYHYPIEIQFNTLFDRQLNNWLHDYLYKKEYPSKYGKIIRQKYEDGEIRTESDFKGVLIDGILGSQK